MKSEDELSAIPLDASGADIVRGYLEDRFDAAPGYRKSSGNYDKFGNNRTIIRAEFDNAGVEYAMNKYTKSTRIRLEKLERQNRWLTIIAGATILTMLIAAMAGPGVLRATAAQLMDEDASARSELLLDEGRYVIKQAASSPATR